jgi:hypothetical protein
MNKKANTILFVLAATVLNVLVMGIVFTLLLVVFSSIAPPTLSPEFGTLAVAMIFLATIIATYVLYHYSVKLLSRKVDLEQYFEPIFRTRKRTPRRRTD